MRKTYGMLAVLLAAALLGGCGARSKSAAREEAAAETAAAAPAMQGEVFDMAAPEEAAVEEAAGEIASTSGMESINASAQKLIKTVGMSMETKEFDALLENIRRKVEEAGGYIESSDISGSSYYSAQGNRYAWLSLRIPSDKLDGFITVVSELGNVTNRHESVQDITLEYVDVESHKKALAMEQERLLELLENAETMEDILAIESRLSEVRYALQSYESTLRAYDNQVNYSTVSIDISEVERVTPVEERGFFGEIKYRMSENFYNIGQGFERFAIWFISSLPYLVIWAAVIAVIVCAARKIFRKKPFFGKRKNRKAKEAEQKDAEAAGKEERRE